MTTTYTVLADPTGYVLARGLTVEEAAVEVLNRRAASLQGRAYEVRQDGRPSGDTYGWTLWVAARRGSGMEDAGIYVVASTRTEAWEAIASLVVQGRLDDAPACIPDDQSAAA